MRIGVLSTDCRLFGADLDRLESASPSNSENIVIVFPCHFWGDETSRHATTRLLN